MSRTRAFGPNLWLVDGPIVSFFGIPYPTRMVIARLRSGALWIWSPVALDTALATEIESLGDIRFIVSPNKIHHLFMEPWKLRWPEAQTFAPPGLTDRRLTAACDMELTDDPPTSWEGQIDQVILRGSRFMEEVVFFHRESSTCIVGDLIQRHSEESHHGWKSALMKLDGLVGREGSTPREWRVSFMRRAASRQYLRTMLSWQPERLIIAHGECADTKGAEVLEGGLRWLTRPWPL